MVNTLYPPLSVGGAERSVEDLSTRLARRGCEVRVLTQTDGTAPTGTYDLSPGLSVTRWKPNHLWQFGDTWAFSSNLSRLRWHAQENRRSEAFQVMRDTLSAFSPDVVHTHNIAGFGPAVWSATGRTPLVHTLRDYYMMCARTTFYRRDHRCRRRCMDCFLLTFPRRRWPRKPDVVIGISKHILDTHERAGLFSHAHSMVLHNAPASHAVPQRHVRHLRTIGFLGRLESAKGLPVILAALAETPKLGIQLSIAGSGRPEEEASVRQFAESDERVLFLGRVTPAMLFSGIDALVVPSQWDEPFGRVAAEARDLNLPVIAARVGGLEEALDGYDGAIFVDSYTDPKAWAEVLRVVSANWVSRQVGASVTRAGSDRSTVDGLVNDHLSIYKRLADEPLSPADPF